MPLGIELLIAVLLGGAAGFLLGWLAKPGADSGLESELRQDKEQLKVEVDQLRGKLSEANNLLATLKTESKFLNEQLLAEKQQIETIQERFQKEFQAISNKLLVDNSTQFSKQSTESLSQLLSPIKDELKDFKTKLENARIETATNSALLKDEVGRIGKEAANLSKALRGDVKVLGNWGENMLDQILEKSGLQKDIHYRRQLSSKDAEGGQRYLDVIIELPDKKNLVIDSKVSLKSYEDYSNGTDEILRQNRLQSHIESIRVHFKGLGAKRYQDTLGINAPDFVLMYIPIEGAFFAALSAEPSLFAEALDRNVVLITNSTLLATLRTVANVWRLADQQKNAVDIAKRGGELHDKFVDFIADLENVGKSLKSSQEAWESATKRLHTGKGNLIRQADMLKTLGAKTSKTIPSAIVDKADTGTEANQLPDAIE